jgi:hypothetical protein
MATLGELTYFACKLLRDELAARGEKVVMRNLGWNHRGGVNLFYVTDKYRLQILVRDLNDFEIIRD